MGLSLKYIFHKKEKAVLFFEPGGIGDYMFCRPFFKFIHQSERFKNLKKVYIVKDYFAEFMNAYDSQYFDEIISYSTSDFENDRYYRKYLFNKLNRYKYEQIVNLRTVVVDNLKDYNPRKRIIRTLKSSKKTVNAIYVKNNDRRLNQMYNNVIFSDKKYDFELERKRKFFEELLGIKIGNDYSFKIEQVLTTNNNIAISMFATSERRMLTFEKWKQIIHKISELYPDKNFVFLGSQGEKKDINKFVQSLNCKDRCKNLAGTPFSVIPDVLRQCELLLSVESGNVHLAQSVGCKTICFSNGSYYQRFHPYPDSENVKYIYSEQFLNNLNNNKIDLWDTYGGNQDWAVDGISVDDVTEELNNFMRGA